jgi:hypothetical protein
MGRLRRKERQKLNKVNSEILGLPPKPKLTTRLPSSRLAPKRRRQKSLESLPRHKQKD